MNEKFEKALEVILLLHERNKFLEEELKTEISKKELIGSFLNRQTKELEEVKKVKAFLEGVIKLMEESVIEVNEANRQLGGKCESLVLQSVSDAVKIKDMQEKVTNLEAELNDRISNDDVKYMVHMQETMEKNYDKLFKEYHDLKSDFFKINQENFNMKRKIKNKNKDNIICNLEIDVERGGMEESMCIRDYVTPLWDVDEDMLKDIPYLENKAKVMEIASIEVEARGYEVVFYELLKEYMKVLEELKHFREVLIKEGLL